MSSAPEPPGERVARVMPAIGIPQRAWIALAAIALAALVAGLVCASDGSGPADAATRLVPASALVYVHLSTDPAREPDARLARLAGALPPVRALRKRIVDAVSPHAFDLERDVRPWLGAELAYAAVSPRDPLVLAAVADLRKAEALVARVGNLSASKHYRGVRVLSAGPTALAFVGEFLALGSEAAVHAAIDRDAGDGEALADLPGYRRAAEGRPAARSLDAYASADGVRDVLAARDGLLGALGALLDRPGLSAAGASLTAEQDGLRAHVRLVGGAPRDAAFEPLLLEQVPEEASAYFGVRNALRLMRALGRLGIERPVAQLGERLASEAGIDLDRDLLAPLSGELALAVTSAAGTPVVTIKAHTADQRRTESALARLQQPVARRLAMPGTVPAFEVVPLGELNAFTLSVTPALAPSYAIADGTLVLSTSRAGLEPPRGTLAAARAFEATVGELPAEADSLVFLDLRALSALAEQTGLTAIPGLATARDELDRVRAAGAVVAEDRDHPSDTTAELFLEIP